MSYGGVSRGTFRLDESATVVFDVNGNGVSFVQPGSAREIWNIGYISVNSSSLGLVPVVKFYRGSIVEPNFITGTFSGTLDVDSMPNTQLRQGERMWAQWIGGDPGATGTFTITGTKMVI